MTEDMMMLLADLASAKRCWETAQARIADLEMADKEAIETARKLLDAQARIAELEKELERQRQMIIELNYGIENADEAITARIAELEERAETCERFELRHRQQIDVLMGEKRIRDIRIAELEKALREMTHAWMTSKARIAELEHLDEMNVGRDKRIAELEDDIELMNSNTAADVRRIERLEGALGKMIEIADDFAAASGSYAMQGAWHTHREDYAAIKEGT
jgi:chromosome segregation ATPase